LDPIVASVRSAIQALALTAAKTNPPAVGDSGRSVLRRSADLGEGGDLLGPSRERPYLLLRDLGDGRLDFFEVGDGALGQYVGGLALRLLQRVHELAQVAERLFERVLAGEIAK
jgi:hypothetical protein